MSSPDSCAAPQTIISSPPNTAFNLKTLFETLSADVLYEPEPTSTAATRILLWLNTTPLLLHIPANISLTNTTQFTVTAITDNTTPADIENLLWGYLSDCIFLTDTEQIESEAQTTATVLPDAHTASLDATIAINDAYDMTDTIEDNNPFDAFHIAIAQLTKQIETAYSKLTNCQTHLDQFNTTLTQKDVKSSAFNDTAQLIISNCEQTAATITELLEELPSITPDTLTQAFSSVRSRLDTIRSHLQQITERIEHLYTSATGNTLSD